MEEQNLLASWCRGVWRLMEAGHDYPQHEAAVYADAMRQAAAWPEDVPTSREAVQLAALGESAAQALEAFAEHGREDDLVAALLAVEAWWEGQRELEELLLETFFAELPAA
ncbi:MAG: hypothetical protein ACYCW6_11685 [Candidatus Xenobia bacterium]